MKKQFVTYKIALKLKKLGFDEEVVATYDTDENNELKIFAFSVPDKGVFETGFKKGWCIKAPLWQQVIDWFRTKYDIFISIDVECDHEFNVYIPYLYQYTVLHKDKTIIISKSSHYNYYTNLDSAIIETINFIWNQSL